MNKTFKFMTLAVAAMSMAACSSELEESKVATGPQWSAEGNGYLALTVSMPANSTANRVKKHANDNYVQGTVEEFEVKDGLCMLFDGGTKKFSQAFSVGTNFGNGVGDGRNVTTDNLIVKKVESVDQPLALVVLNSNGLFVYDEENNKLTVAGTEVQTYEDVLTATSEVIDYKKNGFLMTNAPLWSKPGTSIADPVGGEMTILADAAAAIYPTETEATTHANGVVEVYVERALAKVSLNAPAEKTVVADGFDWQVNKWVLDNTNTTSYLVRNVENLASAVSYNAEDKGYRMVGGVTVSHNAPVTNGAAAEKNNYRTYFGKATNYQGTGHLHTQANFNWDEAKSVNTHDYCAENVFEVAHMTYGNTTRAVLKTTLTPQEGECLYAKAGDPHFYKAEDVKKMAFNYAMNHYTSEELEAIATALSKDKTTIQYSDATVEFKSDADGVTVKFGSEGKGEKTVTASQLNLTYYAGGVAYYDVRVKHFGDEYTPWNEADHVEANTVSQSYGATAGTERDNKYLGRWGVLRNNWYELTVNSIKKIGYATTEEIDVDPNTPGGYNPNTPDDNKMTEEWIAVDVNILSWAKRTQQVDF